jgi:hypothetical protein
MDMSLNGHVVLSRLFGSVFVFVFVFLFFFFVFFFLFRENVKINTELIANGTRSDDMNGRVDLVGDKQAKS